MNLNPASPTPVRIENTRMTFDHALNLSAVEIFVTGLSIWRMNQAMTRGMNTLLAMWRTVQSATAERKPMRARSIFM